MPYSYTITSDDATKVDARRKIVGMSMDVIEKMRDELIEAGIREWLEHRGLTFAQVDAIFGMGNGKS